MVTDVETWSVRVAGWSAKAAPRALDRSAEIIAVPDSAFDGAALLVSVPPGGDLTRITDALVKAGASVRSAGPRRQPRDPLYGAPPKSPVQPAVTTPETAMTVLPRPQPRPGVLEIDAYVPGKSSAPGVAKIFKLSSNETPLGAEPEGDRGLQRRRQASRGLSGRLGHRSCATRSAACSGSIPAASSAAPAPTICSICWRAPISPTATRRSTPRTASWSIRSRRSAPAPRPWSRRRRTSPPTSTRSSSG